MDGHGLGLAVLLNADAFSVKSSSLGRSPQNGRRPSKFV